MSDSEYPPKLYLTNDGRQVYYAPVKDYEDDNIKIFHDFNTIDGRYARMHCDWSPYSHMTEENLDDWFALGCPTRDSIGDGLGSGNLDSTRLKAARAKTSTVTIHGHSLFQEETKPYYSFNGGRV